MTSHATVNITSRPTGFGEPPAPTDDRMLRLLADPLRAQLVALLATEQLCTCHLADATGSLPSAVSNQLRHLREAGLVEREAAGRFVYYRLRPDALAQVGARLTALAAAAELAEKRPC
jgi:ArsR family transcriptional regulator, arsenate/arsenite/antimonite-responsive transcriptional repressor